MLSLYNTLTRQRAPFTPIDAKKVGMYVCGPTVYDRPHLGNARSVVVYDVLYRLLIQQYGAEHVTYVRNITDVDDKINAAAQANGEPISALTARVEGWFHEDMKALNCLDPSREPKATQHIAQMILMIGKLIVHKHAYESKGHVLFAVDSYKDYGKLSGRKLEDLIAGARVEVESYKKHPGDFVLWKPADEGDDPSSVFDSPWGKGRPGWHIECSAMSGTYLGEHFDIHGGGADLMFPHHENEIAQSCCANPGSQFAHCWVHNGFLTVNGEKMSKSLGNFITVKNLLDKHIKGDVIRYALLSSKYNEPLDWSEKLLSDAQKSMTSFNFAWRNTPKGGDKTPLFITLSQEIVDALSDDLNMPLVFNYLHQLTTEVNNAKGDRKIELCGQLSACLDFLGFNVTKPVIYNFKTLDTPKLPANTYWATSSASVSTTTYTMSANWFGITTTSASDQTEIQARIDARIAAKKAKNWAEADRIRKELAGAGILLEDRPDGTTDWRRG